MAQVVLLIWAALASASVCEPALSVASRTGSCGENAQFVNAARACLASLNALEAKYGAEALAIAAPAARSQHGENRKGQGEFGFSARALGSLIVEAVAAEAELLEYSRLVAPPADIYSGRSSEDPANPYGWFDGIACYGETRKSVHGVREEILAKHARYVARREESLRYRAKLSVQDYGSAAAKAAAGSRGDGGAAVRVPAGSSHNEGSDITGTKPVQSEP